jgi:hypothetical protein
MTPRDGSCGDILETVAELIEEKRVNYKKQPAYLGLVFVALVACGAKDPQAQKPNAAAQAAAVRALESKLAGIAGRANQVAPAEVDANTRLEGVRAGPGLRLTSTYTLLDPESEGISSTTFDAKLVPIVKTASCSNADLRPLIDQGVVVVLEYRGKDGSPIGTLSINRATCGALK